MIGMKAEGLEAGLNDLAGGAFNLNSVERRW